jgi:hypothetical protein
MARHLLQASFLQGFVSTSRMEEIHFFETTAYLKTTWQCIPQDSSNHKYRCGDLKFYETFPLVLNLWTSGSLLTNIPQRPRSGTARYRPSRRCMRLNQVRNWNWNSELWVRDFGYDESLHLLVWFFDVNVAYLKYMKGWCGSHENRVYR